MPPYIVPAPDGIAWLTLLLLSPLFGVLLLTLGTLTKLDERTTQWGVVAWMLVPLGIAVYLTAAFQPDLVRDGQAAIQFAEKVPWIDAVRVDYFVGLDGLNLPMVLLTTLIAPIAVLAPPVSRLRPRLYYTLLLLLEAAMLGYFVALDFFFFFIFWEFSLVPAFFMLLIWGRDNHRSAGFIFFIYTMAGSIGMLLLFQFIYLAVRAAGVPTFDLIALGRLGQGLGFAGVNTPLQAILFDYAASLGITQVLGNNPLLYSGIAFWAIFIAFAIKLAVFPFHTWQPDSYTTAPTGASIMLAAVMSKMGAYGMLRIMLPLVPEAANVNAPIIGGLALLSILAGAYGALANVQGDMKRLIAYTSINHMGYVVLAIAAAAAVPAWAAADSTALLDSRAMALNGALLQMVAHGLSTAALFLLAGMLYVRVGTYNLTAYGGLRVVAPTFAGMFGVAMFANLGLPGLAGFVAEFFIFRGAWATLPFTTLLATVGLVVTALALLRLFDALFLGRQPTADHDTADHDTVTAARTAADLSPREFWLTAPLLLALLALGIFPSLVMNLTNVTVTEAVGVFARLVGQ